MKPFRNLWVTFALVLACGVGGFAIAQPTIALAAETDAADFSVAAVTPDDLASQPDPAYLVLNDSDGNPIEKPGIEVFRVNNTATGEHLYTTSTDEVGALTQVYGTPWVAEGIAWYAPGNGIGVYRLNNVFSHLHLYTTDANEVQTLTHRGDWTLDNAGKPLFNSGGSVAIYRLYNPTSADHHLTTDRNEYQTLPAYGWTPEGHKLSAAASGEPYPNERQVILDILQLQDYFPDGTPWDNSIFYASSASIPVARAGYGCYAFALLCSDMAFGWLPGRLYYDTSQIRPGDMLRINGDTHSVVVLERDGDQLLIAEGNINSSVMWGRTIRLSQTPIDYMITRYPR